MRSWQEAAASALEYINSEWEMTLSSTPEQALEECQAILAKSRSAANSLEWEEWELVWDLTHIAAEARGQCWEMDYDDKKLLDILEKKMRAYGHNNILAFGLTGLHVRVSDKVHRIQNMLDKNRHMAWEPLEDSWIDLVGYGVIAKMLHQGTFTLELEES